MPGVNVTTATRSGPVAQNIAPSGRFFVAGMAERGSTTAPVLVQSLLDFAGKFGDRVSYSHLYDNVATFFEEGGSQAYVLRVVGDTPTVGTATLYDGAYAPLATMRVDAKNPGAWSQNLEVKVEAGTVVDSFTLTVIYNDATVEVYRNILTPAAAVTATADSQYIVVVDLGSVTVAPDNNPAADQLNLSAGTDDRATVDADNYTAALALFDTGLGDGVVAIPGVGSTVHAALVAHAEANRRIALLSDAETADSAALMAAAGGLDSDYAGLFAPWVQIKTSNGSTVYTSPEGYVAAVRNRALSESGPWRAPAGQVAAARSLVGLKYDYNRAMGDALDAAKVSAIRTVTNSIRLYGWRSLSNDIDNFALLTARDTLNTIQAQAETVLEEYVFQAVDQKGHLLSAINGALVGIVQPMALANGLYPRVGANEQYIDPGYLVETGMSVNTLENLANNEVRARISVRISPTAALISVTIVKIGLLTGL